MFTIAVLFSLLVAVNLAAFWIWLIRRIEAKGYGAHSRRTRIARMMPLTDRTVVVERRYGAPDTVRTVEATPGAVAGSPA